MFSGIPTAPAHAQSACQCCNASRHSFHVTPLVSCCAPYLPMLIRSICHSAYIAIYNSSSPCPVMSWPPSFVTRGLPLGLLSRRCPHSTESGLAFCPPCHNTSAQGTTNITGASQWSGCLSAEMPRTLMVLARAWNARSDRPPGYFFLNASTCPLTRRKTVLNDSA